MSSVPVYAALVGAIGLFAVWVHVMLRAEGVRRSREAHGARLVVLAQRHATRAARYEPETEPEAAAPVIVRAGAFCRVPGAAAVDEHGNEMTCVATAQGRPRWRALARSAAS